VSSVVKFVPSQKVGANHGTQQKSATNYTNFSLFFVLIREIRGRKEQDWLETPRIIEMIREILAELIF
jgi:hypothetical protein